MALDAIQLNDPDIANKLLLTGTGCNYKEVFVRQYQQLIAVNVDKDCTWGTLCNLQVQCLCFKAYVAFILMQHLRSTMVNLSSKQGMYELYINVEMPLH